ncbi:gamma-glutamyltranspeptidase 1-like, partial [Orbicella faveolata]|uniref:gamma-glutamyltranspeptidase 1-like n=1 Tax=Orbicella faveolata TaxID=48498 RepID=UPI0009E4AEBE
CRKKAGCGAIGFLLLVAIGAVVYVTVGKKSDQSTGGPYERQAVATDTPQCSQIGKDILNANGSAVDAAIAAMFCLGVISMHSSGIGGGGVMLVYNRSLHEASVIDFRETAPALAYRDMFKGNEQKAQKGGLSIAVPGEVRGQYEAWKRYGWLPWKQLVQPAIELARNGFKITAAVDDALKTTKGLEQDIRNDPGLSELLLDKNKKLRKKGDKIKNEKYAKTLEQVQNDPESFYSGQLANDIAEDIRIVNGIVKLDDLRRYKLINRKPYKGELSGMNMYLTPPPTSGLSIAVPGEVRGQHEAWKRYGWLPWKQLVQPAIDLARNGFEITKAVDDALKTTKGIEQDIRNDPGLRSVHITC